MFRYLFHHPVSLLVKMLSLSAGLLIGIVLFSTVAFDLSYESFLPDSDRVYRLQLSVSQNNNADNSPQEATLSASVLAGMAPLLAQKIPFLEAGTTAYRPGSHHLVYDNQTYQAEILYADSCWFKVLPFRLLSGDAQGLAVENNILLSESLARNIFKGTDPVGQTVLFNKTLPYTVIGVFEDVPENCHLQFDAVGSFVNMESQFGFYTGWKGGDSFLGYVKAAPGTDPRTLESTTIDNLFKEQGFDFLQDQGIEVSYYFVPLQDIYPRDPATRTRIVTFTLIGAILLLVCSLNYILLSLSSLERRSKTIAVRKTAGAGGKDLFRLFLAENAAVVMLSTALAALGLLALRGPLGSLTGITLGSLFTWQRLWVPLCVMAAVFLTGGIIPATLYSSVPITHAFRTPTPANRLWKHFLLALQLAGAAFAITLLIVVVRQYHLLTKKDLGYDYDRVACFKIDNLTPQRLQNALATLEAAPYIEKAGYSNHLPIDHMFGMPVEDPQTKDILFLSRRLYCNAAYLETMGFRPAQGRFFTEDSPADCAIISQSFVAKRHWDTDPIGQLVSYQNEMPLTVIGVVQDFQIASLREALEPIIITPLPVDEVPEAVLVSVRLTEFTRDNLAKTFDLLSDLFPDQIIQLRPYNAMVLSQYEKEEAFRRTVTLTCAAAWFIALTGLVAFLASETRRRRRELALRRVHGATRREIFRLNTRSHTVLALIGIGSGLIAADLTARVWLTQFAARTTLPWWLFVATAVVVSVLLCAAFYLQSVRITHENPTAILHNN